LTLPALLMEAEMAVWVKVAEGTSFDDLHSLVADRELRKGTRVKCVMETHLPGAAAAFNIAPNWGWPAPEGMSVVDIWGEGGILGSTGVVEMEADPAWLLAVFAFIKAHWVAIAIAATVLGLIITGIAIWVLGAEVILDIFKWGAILVVAVSGVYLVGSFVGGKRSGG